MSKFFTPAQFAFFIEQGIFLKKLPRTKRAAFDACKEDFEANFGFEYTIFEADWDAFWTNLQSDYAASLAEKEASKAAQAELREAEKVKRAAEREAAKAEKQAAKAAQEAMRPVAAGNATAQDHITRLPAGRYLLTSAQNNTYADPSFIKALETFAQANDCQILIGQTLYNKGAFRQPGLGESEDEGGNALWFDPALEQYLVESHIDLDGFAHFMANANVIPTSTYPTSGFEAATPPGVHTIIPATRIELRVTAALQTDQTKIIAATGTTTQRNYILRKTGAIATLAHKIGAVFVDTIAGTIRHLEQMPGCDYFYDELHRYESSGHIMHDAESVAALQLGDIHAEKMEPQNLAKALELIHRYAPENLVLHDVLDFSSRNHHNVKDATFIHAQMLAGNTVEGDIEVLAIILDALAGEALTANDNANIHIIESNHDLAINTWLKNADFKDDPTNAITYLQLMLHGYRYQEVNEGKWPNMLAYAYASIGQGRYVDDIHFHVTDESVIIAGVESGNHGHNGANGARGNPKAFGKMGIPISTGHTHSPSIYGDCYTAGVAASLEMGYNIGASSWAIAHVLTYENGQRQILFA